MENRESLVEPITAPVEEARKIAELLGLLNESKRLSMIAVSPTRALMWQSTPLIRVREETRREIRRERLALRSNYVKQLKQEFKRAVEVGRDAAIGRVNMLISGAFEESRNLGLRAMGRETSRIFDASVARAAASEEATYATKFLDDYIAASDRTVFESRFAMYGNTLSHQFNIAAYHATPMRARVFWEMSSLESCLDCELLSAGSPYTGDFGEHPLPTVPQAGETRCFANCRCYLRWENDETYIGTEPDMSYEVREFEGEEVSDEWLRTNKGRSVQRALNDRFRLKAHHAQLDTAGISGHAKEARNVERLLAAYIAANQIIGTPRADEADYIAPVRSLMDGGLEPIEGPSEYEGEAVILRGLRLTVGEGSRITANAVRMKLADGRERVYSHGDKAGASLWKPIDR